MGRNPPHLRLRQNNLHNSKKESRKEPKKLINDVAVKYGKIKLSIIWGYVLYILYFSEKMRKNLVV